MRRLKDKEHLAIEYQKDPEIQAYIEKKMDEWNLLLANYKMVCLQQKEVNQQRRGGNTQPMETPGWGTKDDYLQTFWILFKEQGQLLLSFRFG